MTSRRRSISEGSVRNTSTGAGAVIARRRREMSSCRLARSTSGRTTRTSISESGPSSPRATDPKRITCSGSQAATRSAMTVGTHSARVLPEAGRSATVRRPYMPLGLLLTDHRHGLNGRRSSADEREIAPKASVGGVQALPPRGGYVAPSCSWRSRSARIGRRVGWVRPPVGKSQRRTIRTGPCWCLAQPFS